MAGRNPSPEPVAIDCRAAHPSRVYDFMLGGDVHFAVDREAATQGAEALPGGFERACAMVRDQRSFMRRAVTWLAGDIGLRQFLDVGTGIPNGDSLHQLVRPLAPDARIVYVDNDPIVLAHAASLLRGTEEETTAYLQEDIRRPTVLCARAGLTLDFREPVALLLVGILHLIDDRDDPWSLVESLVSRLAAGSYVVVSHMAHDLEPEMTEAVERANKVMREPFVLRDRDEVERFLTGLQVVGPGLATVDRWTPPAGPRAWPPSSSATPFYAAVGRKEDE